MLIIHFAATALLALCGALVVYRLLPPPYANRSPWLRRFAILSVGAIAGLLGHLLARGL